MTVWKSFNVKGTKRYMKDGRLIRESQVPSFILRNLQNVPEIDDSIQEIEMPKECLFCGKETKLTKFVNLKTIYICEEHYYSESTGRVAQRLREMETTSG